MDGWARIINSHPQFDGMEFEQDDESCTCIMYPDQPHIVQLAAELVDSDTREVIDNVDVIVKPDGWVISPEMTDIHGITHEHAMAVGIPENEAIAKLLDLQSRANLRVAHNRQFDDRIVRIGLKRFFDTHEEITPEGFVQPSESWKSAEGYCTCQASKKALGLKKLPTLQEAYAAMLGAEFEGAHSAMSDTSACKAVYFALINSTGHPANA